MDEFDHETIDSYYDLSPIDKIKDDALQLYEESLAVDLRQLHDAFHKLLSFRDTQSMDNKEIEKSQEWAYFKRLAKKCSVVLDEYLRSMGIIPGAIFK